MRAPKRSLSTYFFLAVISLTGCKIIDPLPDYEVTPDPLRVRGDSVEVKVKVDFKPKSFHKKAIIKATPMLVYEGGEKSFEAVTFQGEKVTENHESIPYKKGKSYTYTDQIPYNENLNVSEFKVKLDGKKGNKTKTFTSDKLADGVITTPYLMMSDDKVLLGKDKFQRVTKHQQKAVIHYLVNSPRVRRSELRDDDIKEFEKFVKMAAKDEKLTLKNLEVISYASPEGEISRNEDLAKERAESASDYAKDVFTDHEIEKAKNGAFYNKKPQGEDWEGFKKAMQKSDIKDKELIIRVLEQYDDRKRREKEIRNMAETFTVLQDKILPDLRRSRMRLHYEKMGKTDKQLKKLAKSNPDSLNKEELMKAATLFDDLNQKLEVYKAVEKNYPDDWRGPNNVGYVLMMQNKLNKAKEKFDKAAGIEETAIVKNNLGVVARLKGDRAKAKKLFKDAKSAGSEVSYNLGLVNIQNGNYEAAKENMSGNTFNTALLKVLMEEYDAALNTIDKAPKSNTAMGYYLKAIIGARKEKKEMVINNLKSAVKKDGSLKEKAKKDVEFVDYWETSEFKGVVGGS